MKYSFQNQNFHLKYSVLKYKTKSLISGKQPLPAEAENQRSAIRIFHPENRIQFPKINLTTSTLWMILKKKIVTPIVEATYY
jgi:hypothetical protein